jgi:ComEC/Rec2-related protein
VLQIRNKYFIPETGSFLLLISFFLAWQISSSWHFQLNTSKNILNGKWIKTRVQLESFPTRNRKNAWVLKGKIASAEYKGNSIPVSCGIYITTDTLEQEFRPGDLLEAEVKLYSVSDTAEGFQSYLYGIGTGFTSRKGVWKKIGESNSIMGQALQLSAWFHDQLLLHIQDPQTAGLAVALVTGDRSGLDKELSERHRKLGTTHILSVSGLHVGLICLVLIKLLILLDKLGLQGKRIRVIVVMISLAGYALITGLAPSVCRAVLMTLVSLTGQLFNRKAEGGNVLSFACILELSWEPCWLFYPGFQLSFAALAGLIWIQPLLLGLWEPEYSWLNRFWEMSATAIAAQWSTLPFLIPLAIDFPLYFLPANILIVPIASLLTGAAFALVLVSPVQWVPDIIGYGIHWIAIGMDWIAGFLNSLPMVSVGLPLNSVSDAWILGVVMYSLVFLLKWRKGEK